MKTALISFGWSGRSPATIQDSPGDRTTTRRILFSPAREVRESVYGKYVFMRGLIESTNYFKTTAITAVIPPVIRKRRAVPDYERTNSGLRETGYKLGSAPLFSGRRRPVFNRRADGRHHSRDPEG
jgi:hypothetical protein